MGINLDRLTLAAVARPMVQSVSTKVAPWTLE